MESATQKTGLLRHRLQQLSQAWKDEGLPSREKIEAAAAALEKLKQQHQIKGLWAAPPLMFTATLDDGLGQGLAIIERFARIMGLTVHHLGLLQRPDAVLAHCRQGIPDFLGMTVLQLDSDEDLARIGRNLPAATCLIAGGAAFRSDPELARRCHVDFFAPNVAHFMDFLSRWSPPRLNR